MRCPNLRRQGRDSAGSRRDRYGIGMLEHDHGAAVAGTWPSALGRLCPGPAINRIARYGGAEGPILRSLTCSTGCRDLDQYGVPRRARKEGLDESSSIASSRTGGRCAVSRALAWSARACSFAPIEKAVAAAWGRIQASQCGFRGRFGVRQVVPRLQPAQRLVGTALSGAACARELTQRYVAVGLEVPTAED